MTEAKCQACSFRFGVLVADGVRLARGVISQYPAHLQCPRCAHVTRFLRGSTPIENKAKSAIMTA